MSRVERTENTPERRGTEQTRQAERGRGSGGDRKDATPGHTPSKAEGEVRDVEEALKRESE